MAFRNQQRNGRSLIRDSQKKKARARIVERGSMAPIRVLSADRFSNGGLTEEAIFVPRSVGEIIPYCLGFGHTERSLFRIEFSTAGDW
jgi:hypothetical protein